MRRVSGRVTGGGGGANIVISDGHSVSTTDDSGRFSLSVEGPFVFLRRPTGLGADPWFVTATTVEPEFTLFPEHQQVPFRFTHITDLHISAPPPTGEPEIASSFLRLTEAGDLASFLAADDAAFVVATGDLTNQGTTEEYAGLLDAVASSNRRVHLLPGNHDHMNGVQSFVTTIGGAWENAADTRGYEHHLGPRWYSFDYAGVHFVALDWHSRILGIDGDAQLHWLEADLAHVDPSMPWILLFHDQPDHALMDALPRPPIATFSGHRHTNRSVMVNGVHHVNTPTAFFAGLDSSPPTYRVAQWDGAELTIETVSSGSAHIHQPCYCPRTGCVIVGAQDGVEAMDVHTLGRSWMAELDAPVRGRPVMVESTVVAVTVTGRMVGIDARTGSLLWHVDSSDPLHQWAFNDPATDGSVVIAGDSNELSCVEISTGSLRWRIPGIASGTNIVARASCVVVDGLVLGGFWPGSPPRFALDITNGAVVWTHPSTGPSIADEFTGPSPHATPALDPGTGLVIIPCAARVDAVDPRTGEIAWSARLPTFFNLASPVITEVGIALTLPGRGITMLDRISGVQRWRADISGPAPIAMVPYERAPSSPAFAAPCVAGDALALPGLDGSLRILDQEDGSCRKEISIGVPVAAPPLSVGELLVVRGTDGSLHVVDAGSL